MCLAVCFPDDPEPGGPEIKAFESDTCIEKEKTQLSDFIHLTRDHMISLDSENFKFLDQRMNIKLQF